MVTWSPWSPSTGAPSSGTVAAIRRTGTWLPARFTSGASGTVTFLEVE